MQVCTSLQTDNPRQRSTTLCFLQAGCPSCRSTNSVKALKVSKYVRKSICIAHSNQESQRLYSLCADCVCAAGNLVINPFDPNAPMQQWEISDCKIQNRHNPVTVLGVGTQPGSKEHTRDVTAPTHDAVTTREVTASEFTGSALQLWNISHVYVGLLIVIFTADLYYHFSYHFPGSLQPDFDLPRHTWVSDELFQGPCRANLHKWCLSYSQHRSKRV